MLIFYSKKGEVFNTRVPWSGIGTDEFRRCWQTAIHVRLGKGGKRGWMVTSEHYSPDWYQGRPPIHEVASEVWGHLGGSQETPSAIVALHYPKKIYRCNFHIFFQSQSSPHAGILFCWYGLPQDMRSTLLPQPDSLWDRNTGSHGRFQNQGKVQDSIHQVPITHQIAKDVMVTTECSSAFVIMK